ncbi:hypothetical protein [Streptomyces sp. NRRL F-5126]|uniref:hypothetical protein n=1 Tax=Streptomyces sp. NRRL F-5126 TaxID=1463857 RepID=UPI000B0A6051|nr:hypothetical protein [Streptomyces sp. NRRL F-5126]
MQFERTAHAASMAAPAVHRGLVDRAGAGPTPQLAQLLRTGPFHDALRAAIAASGLSLDRVQDRLRRHGADVSLASLSSWQSGRYRPERPRSLAALRAMERFLPVPDGALFALLGPPRPRGPRPPGAEGRASLESMVPALSLPALSGIDTSWDASLTRISCQTRMEFDENGRSRAKWTRQLLRADRDGPDRWVTVYRLDEPGSPPGIEVVSPCRTGRVVRSHEGGLLAAELLFDRPLARGETVIVEYTLTHAAPRPFETHVEAALHLPVREYVMEARFDPACLPSACYSYHLDGACARDGAADQRSERLLRIDAAGSAHAVALEAGHCRIGLRWAWEGPRGAGA